MARVERYDDARNMAHNSSIEWTHHTFNPWIGCTKVSPACDHCYAEVEARRRGWSDWGSRSNRHITSADYWKAPLRWNRAAAEAGERQRVFCASLADVFEARRDLNRHRRRLWALIDQTPNLDWLLLTKRPHKVASVVPWGAEWPSNVWLGTTVEDQRWADVRVPALLALPAVVRFLSVEPILGPVDLAPYLHKSPAVDWVIGGGESGTKARPPDVDWLRSIRDQCIAANVPFFFKQWGTFGPDDNGGSLIRLGKKRAGRHLDGQVWAELPDP